MNFNFKPLKIMSGFFKILPASGAASTKKKTVISRIA